MADMTTGRSWLPFHLLKVDHDSLSTPENIWSDDTNFIKVGTFIKNVLMVNDPAERAVKLIKDFATKVTKCEQQCQIFL